MKKNKISAVISWELLLPEDTQNIGCIAQSVLSSILPSNFSVNIQKINGNQTKAKKPKEVLGEFSLDEVFSKLEDLIHL